MTLIPSLFGKKKDQPDAPKKSHPVARFMFNPEVGGLVRSIKDVFATFVQLIGYVFVIAQLLPASHPVFTGEITGFKAIGAMLVDASANLEFTWKKIHQILIFYAVVGLFLFVAMMLVTGLFSFLVGVANAQDMSDTSMFISSQDRAGEWLKCVFPLDFNADGKAMPCAVSGAQHIFILAQAIGDMLVFYSKGCLVLAGVIVGYTTVAVVLEAAHSGVFMGKPHNALWAPVRIVWALLLLVPIAPYNFSLGQLAVIKVASLGSGLASNAWNVFLSSTNSLKFEAMSTRVSTPAVRTQISNVLQMALAAETCVQSLWVLDHPDRVLTTPYNGEVGVKDVEMTTYHSKLGDTFTGEWRGPVMRAGEEAFLCGTYKFDAISNVDDSVWKRTYDWVTVSNEETKLKADMRLAAFTANQQAFKQMLPTIRQMALRIAQVSIDAKSAAYHDPKAYMPKVSEYEQLVSQYIDTREKILGKQLESLSKQNAVKTTLETASNYGWLGAGAWLLHISQAINVSENAITSMVQVNLFPSGWFHTGVSDTMTALEQDNQFADKTPEHTMFQVVQKMMSWLKVASAMTDDDLSIGSSDSKEEKASATLEKLLYTYFPLVSIIVNTIGGQGDPFAAMITLGWVLIFIGMAGLVGATALAIKTFGLGSMVGKIASILSMAVLIPGVILAIYLPFLPSLRFLFAFTTWFLAVLESVFAMPIVAIAHLRTDGEGLAGPTGMKSYVFLLQIFVRPILVICGLVGSLLVFNVTVRAINLLLVFAIGTFASSLGGVSGFLFGFGALIIYTGTLYSLANMSFKLIDKIPDDVLTWIGQGGGIKYGLEKNLGNAYKTTQSMATTGQNVLEKGSGALSKKIGTSRRNAAKTQEYKGIAEGVVGGDGE